MPQAELSVVRLLVERQRYHPLLEGFPKAARIGDLPLFLGEAGAAQDAAFLEANGIQAVIALGTGNLIEKPCDALLVDILDMEEELLLPHFDECIEFLKKHLMQEAPTAVLVYCVYGQSRSASICVAYLMATQSLTLLEAYDVVQTARPCISINPGFLRQLELFQRMGNDPNIMGATPAHAELRTMVARRQRIKTGTPDVVATPQLTRPGSSLCCMKCNYVLATTRNQLPHTSSDTAAGACAGIFVEPMKWMTMDPSFVRDNDGKMLCPSCKAKLGSWNWIGVKYVSPLKFASKMQLQMLRQPSISVGSEPNTESRLVDFSGAVRYNSRDYSSMGAAVSSTNASTLLASSSSPNAQAVLEVARTINEQTLQRFTLLCQREFCVGVNELDALFPAIARDTIEQAFAVFDVRNSSAVDSCELFAALILVAPQLSRDAKLKAIFELFNVSTHRRGLMVADEATLLFRTVVVGAAKLLRVVVAPAEEELPRLAIFEDMTKALYGENEALAYENFAQSCQAAAEVAAFLAQWTLDGRE